MNLYNTNDKKRKHEIEKKGNLKKEKYRTEYRRDYARLVHSPSFRRLQGKTQLFPTIENDYFRSRLTHSLEVAQIAKSIAIRINANYKDLTHEDNKHINPDIVEFAALAHDLGHPPFGHIGEKALDQCMLNYGGFEGNAQTLRILTKIEKKFHKLEEKFDYGLNLTYRTLASILKYNKEIPKTTEDRIIEAKVSSAEDVKVSKGYYFTESDIVKDIIKHVTNGKTIKPEFKTIECQIMDIADDIAYCTYDLEDSLKAGFLHPFDLVFGKKIAMNVADKVNDELELKQKITGENVLEILKEKFSRLFDFRKKIKVGSSIEKKDYSIYLTGLSYKTAKNLANINTLRTELTSNLVGSFIRGITFKYNKEIPALSKVDLNRRKKIEVAIFKRFTYESEILSHKIQITEYRGKEIVKSIFDCLLSKDGYRLLPPDFREQYDIAVKEDDECHKRRVVCDFISGMTDRYAVEFYGRLKSENPETIFKPF
jgi:dGTPase